ncbi:regulator of free ubiquitin chains 1 [Kluyveromyces marxianus]|uniref:Regulator of free ubiquitin chains 1 n=2 Tax=Kluyveromyces marxianus TaxID=4911 RepID=W0TID1_KLUMD|nr:regulator of free ubiquitin chains 1 [Kluyveromyces marxianus DMKU3-1042]QGN18030.1 regulator of free ubiquitin chains 1 [Kluyveromyces marxianus]BAO41889.1 regulator of free ubiquitin chains 1 [Kluyveromyces marxianus DMKU3-1042]BAP73317.1 regulator of free ubiquitin chains 1 [Kluyveromyces marxianus]
MRSSSQLKQEALEYKFNANVPLKLYLTTCISIVEEAQKSARSNDMERAYLLYLRYLDLCLNKLIHHSEVNTTVDSLNRREYLQLLKLEVPAIMKITEELKGKIDAIHHSLASNVAVSAYTKPSTRPQAVVPSRTAVEEVQLPSTFDEKKFNQSIRWFHNNPSRFSTATVSSTNEYPELPELNISHTQLSHTMPAL